MRVVQLNATCNSGSTGKICVAVSRLLVDEGIENYILYTQGESNYPLGIKYSNEKYKKVQALKSRILGNNGFNSYLATKKLIRLLNELKPTIVHIHNIHSHDCDINMLFKYLKEKKIKTYWTFHDCWAFTGNCTHFTMVNCSKWKNECNNCPQIRETSWFIDRSRENQLKKKQLFCGLDLSIITPSEWLCDLVKQSFFHKHPVSVINNGIDLKVFKPIKSNFRERYNIKENDYIVLGVSFGWGKKKGLDVFIKMASCLNNRYKIVLVGTDNKNDKYLPNNIISIHRTQNQNELAEIYSAADVFVNATREENFPTVHMESLACGTPVVTFDVGGCKEMLDSSCGILVPCDNIDLLKQKIIDVCESHILKVGDCLKKSQQFDQTNSYNEYITKYKS